VRFLAGTLIGGFALLNALAYNHARAMMSFSPGGTRTCAPERLSPCAKARVLLQGVNLPRPTGSLSPAAVDPDCGALTIASGDGTRLGCWYCDRGAGTPLVLLFHAYGAEKSSMIPQARAFLDLGASVLLVDFRGSGESSESYTTLGVREADDVDAVFRYARARLAHRSVILFGQSMGSAALLRAIAIRDLAPDGIILEAVFDKMLSTIRNRFHAMRIPAFPSAELLVFWGGWQGGFNGFRHNPADYAQAVYCPALVMHGAEDPRATLAEGRRVFDAIPAEKQFCVFPATGHESYIARDAAAWRKATAAFLVTCGVSAPR
jgi:hypothetical protein